MICPYCWLRVRHGHFLTIRWFWRVRWEFWQWAWLPNVRLLRVNGAPGWHFNWIVIYEIHWLGLRSYLKGVDSTNGVLDFFHDII